MIRPLLKSPGFASIASSRLLWLGVFSAISTIGVHPLAAQDKSVPQTATPLNASGQGSDSKATSKDVSSGQNDYSDLLPKPRQRSLDDWARQLNSDRFRTRQVAKEHLIQGGPESVAALKKVLAEGDLESTEAVIAILALIAEDEPPWQNQGAIATLESIADAGFGTKTTIAKSVLRSFTESRDRQAREALAHAGVFVGSETVALGSRSRPQNVVRIDESWNGTVQHLAWIRWLQETPFVIIKGKAIKPEVLEEVIRIPEDITLILVEGTLSDESLAVLAKRDRIEAIEVRYVRLNETQLDQFGELQIRQALHLMGTGAKTAQVEKLRSELPGVAVTARSGGFLGVICRSLEEDFCEVNEVIRGSGADQAGILAGDIVTQIDDTKITRFDDLQRQINTHVPGDKIKIQIRRHRELITTTAVLKKLESQ
ncbi:PDZ domain-containing protein [Roseiconus lacunae]|uniref:PDZ domain-containing protein n=1 Tax=Roseiconus lacunae TaxID=2605694 RepID=UPI00308837DA|nr:PDZ domain-containing protein [Stieleria sp. HD01]